MYFSELPFPSGGTISRHAPLQRQFFPTPQLYSNSLMLMAMPFPSLPPPVPPSLGSLPSKEDSLKLMFSFNKDFSKADKKEKCPLRQEIFERAYRQFNKHMKNGTQLYNSAFDEIKRENGQGRLTKKMRQKHMEKMLRMDWDDFWSKQKY